MKRSTFILTATASIALPHVVDATSAVPAEHHHGVNGTTIPPKRPVNLSIRVLDGPDFALAAQRGKVVIMNFFATWCPAYQREAADIAAFAAANAADTSMVSVDYRETNDTVRAWRKKYGITYPMATDERGGFFHNIGLHDFPSTLFFRPDGTLSCVRVGSLSLASLDEERRFALETSTDGGISGIPSRSPMQRLRQRLRRQRRSGRQRQILQRRCSGRHRARRVLSSRIATTGTGGNLHAVRP